MTRASFDGLSRSAARKRPSVIGSRKCFFFFPVIPVMMVWCSSTVNSTSFRAIDPKSLNSTSNQKRTQLTKSRAHGNTYSFNNLMLLRHSTSAYTPVQLFDPIRTRLISLERLACYTRRQLCCGYATVILIHSFSAALYALSRGSGRRVLSKNWGNADGKG